MNKFLGSTILCAVGLWSQLAAALPYEPFFATVEMVATVSRVTAGGPLYDNEFNYVRDFTTADLDRLPWNVGDRLTVRWQQHSADLKDCAPGDTRFFLGGISGAPNPVLGGSCFGQAASFAQVRRADGSMTSVRDGWESGFSFGPVFDTLTGEVIPRFEPTDGLLIEDCCWYVYDVTTDRIFSFDGYAPDPGDLGSVNFLAARFGEVDGSGGMRLISFPAVDEAEGLLAGFFDSEESLIDVSFDVEWRSTFQRLQVPEPCALSLLGVGFVAAAGLARRRGVRT